MNWLVPIPYALHLMVLFYMPVTKVLLESLIWIVPAVRYLK